MKPSWRIFLSYRGNTVGTDESINFSNDMFEYMVSDPISQELYGDVYFSPKTDRFGDFKKSIPEIMSTVKFFVMPLTKNYFADFWDEKNDGPNKESITYKEINSAIENQCRFICIAFDGFEDDLNLYKQLFGDKYEIISTVKKVKYDPSKKEILMREIVDYIVFNTSFKDASELISPLKKNIFLSFKGITEDKKDFPLLSKIHDIKTITLLNLASTAWLAGVEIAKIYEESDLLKRWFSRQLYNRNIDAEIIILDPYCNAAVDAAKHKMKPLKRTVPYDQIIATNINKVIKFFKDVPNTHLNVYLTRISLPYGLMITSHYNHENDHIKVDIYSAEPSNDEQRPSFYILRSDENTKSIYDFFYDNAETIKTKYSRLLTTKADVSWMKNLRKPIIHKGIIDKGFLPHTKKSFDECIYRKYPMEVDLLELKDGTIIVGRDDFDISQYGYNKKLSECTKSELKKINAQAKGNVILGLSEFLELVGGRIPLLLEIKAQNGLRTSSEKFLDRVISDIQDYLRSYAELFGNRYNTTSYGLAVHSANPNILRYIKNKDYLIPCGIISTNFEKIKDIVGNDFYQMHQKKEFFNIFDPDFVSYDINYIDTNQDIIDFCYDKNIPLLFWTIRSDEEKIKSEEYYCDNIIVEGDAITI